MGSLLKCLKTCLRRDERDVQKSLCLLISGPLVKEYETIIHKEITLWNEKGAEESYQLGGVLFLQQKERVMPNSGINYYK